MDIRLPGFYKTIGAISKFLLFTYKDVGLISVQNGDSLTWFNKMINKSEKNRNLLFHKPFRNKSIRIQ